MSSHHQYINHHYYFTDPPTTGTFYPLSLFIQLLSLSELSLSESELSELPDSLRAAGLAFQEIGDGVAPRQAPYAFYEGRKVAREI